MRPPAIALFILMAATCCFMGYCYALFDWIQDVTSGVYQRERFEAFYETSALVGYHIYGLHFIRSRKL